eukprot:TRINITY_DN9704_c0_g1_i1.p1 TRINITY_DN9704_c0_g1~~TRINITY_DN9704_c0_g1_i1.p1  ORF type:complete len:168 (+),score=52.58 TRINITY_DN9704_c0_g1_i1:214-717(+)
MRSLDEATNGERGRKEKADREGNYEENGEMSEDNKPSEESHVLKKGFRGKGQGMTSSWNGDQENDKKLRRNFSVDDTVISHTKSHDKRKYLDDSGVELIKTLSSIDRLTDIQKKEMVNLIRASSFRGSKAGSEGSYREQVLLHAKTKRREIPNFAEFYGFTDVKMTQ